MTRLYFVRNWAWNAVQFLRGQYYLPPPEVVEAAIQAGAAVHEGAEPPEPDPVAEAKVLRDERRARLAAVEAARAEAGRLGGAERNALRRKALAGVEAAKRQLTPADETNKERRARLEAAELVLRASEGLADEPNADRRKRLADVEALKRPLGVDHAARRAAVATSEAVHRQALADEREAARLALREARAKKLKAAMAAVGNAAALDAAEGE
ncbi:MAG: hypothetical protein GWN29_04930 [Gammaproteobacteria bacterium]|nr:hypothetical protein [Gammaproteobacteria bacterium]NIV51098.1 hypothetical protein [Gammaproteobacteria bacterium]NIW23950.1 hypothetical protein [Gammaproteobacteria bacterium]NIX85040.1 hypothetical protein [Gammaproteobacteria bacterium]